MVQQTPIPVTSQYQGNVIVPLGQLPYSSPYLTNGFTSYSFAQHSPRPLAVQGAWCDSGTFPRNITSIYAEAPSQTSNDVINWNAGRTNTLGGFPTGYLRSMDDRLYGYGSTGGGNFQNLDFWCMFGDRGITQTTKPNLNTFPIIATGSFVQGDLGFACDNTVIPALGNKLVPIYSRNVFGSTFVFSPFNNTAYPNGAIKVKWGFLNNGCLAPYNIGGQMNPVPTAYNADGRNDWSVWGSPGGAGTLHLIKEDNLLEFVTGQPVVSYFNVSLDDPILSARLSNGSNQQSLIPNSAGWTMVIDVTAGANAAKYNKGTNYQNIVIFLSMDMSQYWTLQFMPNTPNVNTCLAFNTFNGVLWSVAADIDGFLYVSNNRQLAGVTGGSTLMSGRNRQTITIPGFDPSIAWNLPTPESTFALPCFDPCSFGDT